MAFTLEFAWKNKQNFNTNLSKSVKPSVNYLNQQIVHVNQHHENVQPGRRLVNIVAVECFDCVQNKRQCVTCDEYEHDDKHHQ